VTSHHVRTPRLAAGLIALGMLAAGCGGDDDNTASATTAAAANRTDGTVAGAAATTPALSGSINLDGSSTVAPLSEVAAELFMKENRGVRITVAVSGTSGGFQKFCSGETDGNNASRPIKQSEIDECAKNGIAYGGVQVANDALSLLVNKNNPIECLTIPQAKQIWDEGSTVKTWGQVDGLNLPEDAKTKQLTLYGPGTDSGTFDFFTEVVNGKSGKIRNDYIDIGEDDFAGVNAVVGDTWAMSYVPYSFVQEAGSGVKPLKIDGGNGCVEATLENVQNGSYSPLGRPLFLYANDKALARPEVQAFFGFYIENQSEIAKTAIFVPMNDKQVTAAEEQVKKLVG
jgi:phosphate transport system substrate-binding protein